MLLLAITWGGGHFPWLSLTIIGLLCGGFAVFASFVWSTSVQQDKSLIPPSCLARRSVYIGSLLMFIQGGAIQLIPFFLPLWFQAILGDDPSESAVHILPSLIVMVLAILTFGALVRKQRLVPPWAIIGSLLTAIGSSMLSALRPDATLGQWIGYQVLTHLGRGVTFQAPVIGVQENVPVADSATSLGVINLFMQLGLAVSVSAAQTVFRNERPVFLKEYAPNIDLQVVVGAGATSLRKLIPAADMPGFLQAYNLAITDMFYFSTAAVALACFLSFAIPWQDITVEVEIKEHNSGSET